MSLPEHNHFWKFGLLVEFGLIQFAINWARVSLWKQLYKPPAPMRMLLSDLKRVLPFISCLQAWAGLSELSTGTPSCLLLGDVEFQEILLPAAEPPALTTAICSRKGDLRPLVIPISIHFLSIFLPWFYFPWPELILSLSVSHLDQILLQL